MKIFIITIDDLSLTNNFIKTIINEKKNEIIGLAITKGSRLTIGKKHSKIQYIISLILIMGIYYFLKNSLYILSNKIKILLSKINLCENPSLLAYANKHKTPTFIINTPNNPQFIEKLKELKPDIIINQSQNILKKELLNIPTIGVINRHNALLPKNRGRITPFWVLYKGEKETGVSIHFVNEKIDSGDIIIQEKYPVTEKDTFNSLVLKNYKIAPLLMLKALEKLEKGEKNFIPNNDFEATYNTIPTLRQALIFRLKLIKKHILCLFNFKKTN